MFARRGVTVLVLIGPGFQGTSEEFGRLAQLTGLVAYDLRTKLKPGAWGLLRLLADPADAATLGAQLVAAGFPVAVVNPDVAHDPSRQFVFAERVAFEAEQLVVQVAGRTMPVPYAAVLTIVQGEVQEGASHAGTPASSQGFRAVSPNSADIQAFRESTSGQAFSTYHAADIHFATVAWSARLDARKLDFSTVSGATGSPAQKLDRLVQELAARSKAPVDKNIRTSSVASFARRPAPMRRARTPVPSSLPAPSVASGVDTRFDAYSRIIAEAERTLRGLASPQSNP
jgi:hypothetical protein